MEEVAKYMTSGGPFALAGGALAWLLTWLRQGRRDAYAQIKESTQSLIDTQNETIKTQGERVMRLEGRIEQMTAQMRHDFADLIAANSTIVRLEGEVADWKGRWRARFPEEVL